MSNSLKTYFSLIFPEHKRALLLSLQAAFPGPAEGQQLQQLIQCLQREMASAMLSAAV